MTTCPVSDCHAQARTLACGYRNAGTLPYCKIWSRAFYTWLALAQAFGWYEAEGAEDD